MRVDRVRARLRELRASANCAVERSWNASSKRWQISPEDYEQVVRLLKASNGGGVIGAVLALFFELVRPALIVLYGIACILVLLLATVTLMAYPGHLRGAVVLAVLLGLWPALVIAKGLTGSPLGEIASSIAAALSALAMALAVYVLSEAVRPGETAFLGAVWTAVASMPVLLYLTLAQ